MITTNKIIITQENINDILIWGEGKLEFIKGEGEFRTSNGYAKIGQELIKNPLGNVYSAKYLEEFDKLIDLIIEHKDDIEYAAINRMSTSTHYTLLHEKFLNSLHNNDNETIKECVNDFQYHKPLDNVILTSNLSHPTIRFMRNIIAKWETFHQ
jgi:hypothetical protein